MAKVPAGGGTHALHGSAGAMTGGRGAASGSNAAPDLILHNARIQVVDAGGSTVEALAIKNTRVVAIGRAADVRPLASPRTRQVDLGGRTVIPGFIDGHPHLDTVAVKLTRPSFEGVTPSAVRKVIPRPWSARMRCAFVAPGLSPYATPDCSASHAMIAW